MSDLYLTEQEKQFFAESEAPKEIKSFSDWSGENNASISDPQSFLNYADFMRNELGESYNAQSEMEIQTGLRQGLSTIEGMDEETIEQTLAPKEADFDNKLNVVFSSLSATDPDRQTLLDYQAGKQIVSEQEDVAEEYLMKVDTMRQQAEAVVNNRFNQTKEDLVNSGQLPFAFVLDEDGNRKLMMSDSASQMSLPQAIKASQLGDVSFNPVDIFTIEQNLKVIPDTGVTVYESKKLNEIANGIKALSDTDRYVSEFLEGHALQAAREEDTTAESVSRSIGRNVAEFLSAAGVADDDIDARRKSVEYASRQNVDSAVEYITEQLNESGANYKASDVRDAYEGLVNRTGYEKGLFKMRADGSDVAKNIRVSKLGPEVNPAIYANEELFVKTLAAHPELSDSTKERLLETRKQVLEDQFDNYNKVLEKSSYSDEWSEALLLGRQAGKKDSEILDEFTSDDEVFSELGARAGGIASSVWDAVTSLVYIAPAALGADWAKQGLIEMSEEQANRRQVAQMFGAEFGVGQDVMEAIAPMIVDIGATMLLSTASAGAAGVAYVAAKGGANLTAKGMIKGITSNILRSSSDEALEIVAKSAVARGLIKETSEAGARNKTIEALRAYNNTVAEKMGLAVGTFVPAATRSTAMSYGSLYNQLKASNPNMSEDEVHDRAMGFAMTSGVATGLITSAFSLIGRGGVETALLKGMTFKDFKSILESAANVGGITDEALSGAMRQVLNQSLSKYSTQFLRTTGNIAKNAFDESLEEGLDQLVNSYVEDVALNQNTPLAERWQQVIHASMVGGILGAGVPTIQTVASRIGITPMDRFEQAAQIREQYLKDVESNLRESGSPMTATTIRQLIGQRKRTAVPVTPTPVAAPAEDLSSDRLAAQNALDAAEQERVAFKQELEQLEIVEQPDETQLARIAELNTILAEKGNEIDTYKDTIATIDAKNKKVAVEEPAPQRDLLKDLENTPTSSINLQTERVLNKKDRINTATNIPPSKSYARRVSKDTIQFDPLPVSGDNAQAVQVRVNEIAAMGYPNRLDSQNDFGLPINDDADASALSDYVASSAYTLYPPVKVALPQGGSLFESPFGGERFNPVTGKTAKITGFVDSNGVGVFDNDPLVVAEMLRANVPVVVPPNFKLSELNPSIVVDPDNNVIDVVAPSNVGNVLESKVTSIEEISEVYYNNVRANRLSSIPFKSVDLPTGVKRFDTANGSTLDDTFSNIANINRSLNAFLVELQKTGEERNIEAHSRMEPLSAAEDTEAQLQAFIEAREQFVFNARMFELREAIKQDPTDKVGKLLSRINLQKQAAAKRVLPLITIDKAGDLNSDAILEAFIDQYAVNNPDLSGNTPPTFASVLSNSTRNFAVQKEHIEKTRKANATLTLPVDKDITKSARKRNDFIDNFGRRPDGEIAAPEDIAAMMASSIDNAIDAINKDQKLRVAVDKFVTDNVFDGSAEMSEVVGNLNPKDLFGFLSSWMVTSNGRVRKSVSDFVTELESGNLFRGIDLRDALIATRFTTRPDGLGIKNKQAVNEFQSMFADITGDILSESEARNTMLAIDGALRTRLSRSQTTAEMRKVITENNNATISKLGLRSGDSESVVKALTYISKGMGNKVEQFVSKLLLEDAEFIRNNVKFVIGEGNIDIAGKYIKSINGNHIVFINRTSGNGRGLINTLLEEYIHAFTSDTVAATEAVLAKNKNKASAVSKLERIFSAVSNKYEAEVASGAIPNSVVENGLENLDEFVSKFFLSEGFQKYIKKVVGPSSFDSIVDSIVTIFPKVSPAEKKSYVAAFKNILDLGLRARKNTTPDARAIGSTAADGVLFSAPVKTTEAVTVEEEVPAMITEEFLEGVSDADRSAVTPFIEFLRGIVPPAVAIKQTVVDTAGGLANVSRDESTIFINPQVLAEIIRTNDSLSAKSIIAVTINEEVAHIASLNALTQEEIDAYVNSLSDADFQSIITEYSENSSAEFAQSLRDLLQSENAEEVLALKRQLAEEKLRMHLQKVTRGFTTEEDVRFWKKRPSLWAILKRYLSGVIRRFAANRSKLGGAGGVALNKMINEMRAIEVGFVRQPTSLAFNPDKPETTYRMLANGTQSVEDLLIKAAPIIESDSEQPLRFHEIAKESLKHDASRVGTAWQGNVKPTTQDTNDGIETVTPANLAKQMAKLTHFDGDIKLPSYITKYKNPKRRMEAFIDFQKDNLIALYDAFEDLSPEYVTRSTHWYDGARLIAEEIRDNSNVSVEQASAIIAAFSPMKDWFQNVAMGQRFVDTMTNYADMEITRASVKTGLRTLVSSATDPAKVKSAFTKINGNSINELIENGDLDSAAVAIRMVSTEIHGLSHDVLSPEGQSLGVRKNKQGGDSKMVWQSYPFIKKALSIYLDGSLENISKELGSKHKIRNFYNNIVAPTSPRGDATIDTHAVNAATLYPMGNKGYLVGLNFGAAGVAGGGNSGIYWIFHEALRQAAAEKGIMPRQMQSITWEAIRGLFTDSKKRDKKFVDQINEIWENEPDAGSARKRILDLGIRPPEWGRVSGDTSGVSARAGEVVGEEAISDAGGGPTVRSGDAGRDIESGLDDSILSSAPVAEQVAEGFPSFFDRKGRPSKVYTTKPAGAKRPEGQPELARKLAFGEITPEEYQEQYDERFGPPVLFNGVTLPASPADMRRALSSSKVSKIVDDPRDIKDRRVQSRLDIPAYNNHGVWVTTLHKDTGTASTGDVIAYVPTAVLSNATFNVKEEEAAAIAIQRAKSPIATMVGDYVPMASEEAYNAAKEASKSEEYVEIGMNPYRHSYFYDKEQQRPLVGAEEVIQIGALLLAKNPQYGNKSDFLFSAPLTSQRDSNSIGLDYAPIVDQLEIPEVEIARNGKPKNSLFGFIDKVLSGEVSEPFRRLIENKKFFKTAVEDDVAKFKKAMDKIVIETYGSFENAPMDLIATAQGYAFQSLVSEEQLEKIDNAHEATLDDIDQRLADGDIDETAARDERKLAATNKEATIERAYEEGLKQAEENRNEALRKLALDSPKLAAFIVDIRQRYIIPMQQKLIASGLDESIELKISNTGEVYLTRAYRMFTDSTYLDMVRNDESYAPKREAAMLFFRKQFIRDQAEKIRSDSKADGIQMTFQEAKQRAERILDKRNESNPSSSYEQEALDAFLSVYDPKAGKSSGSSDSGLNMLMDNFKRRKDLPKAIRDLLGEYGAETGTDLILRTYSTVANIAAQKTFLKRLRVTGESAGVMVNAETKIATEENQEKYKNWVPIRAGILVDSTDPLSDMYVHPDFKDALEKTLKNSYLQEYADTSERVINGAFTLASKLSGKAMAAKTLGSIGFYFRNAIGNFIFGTAQGFFRYDKMIAGMSKASVDALFGLNGEVDPVVTELIGLGVMGDEIRAGVMRDLLNGKQSPAGIQKELENLMDKSKLNAGTKVLAALEKKAQDLSAALDAAFKVAYFYHELGFIERSFAEGGKLYAGMSETQRKREAARKVLMTAQSYSQAPPIITEFTKSPAGLMFAPFLRFKAEMFRIPFNTYKLGLEEFRSEDPVMRARGIRRMLSMTTVLGGLSSALPMIMASVSGIGDDEHEDEAMREGIPEYLRGHTFFYFYLNGKLKSFDATYLNPFAGTVDPILRALEKIRAGEYAEAGAAFALGYTKDQFLDTQILANAVVNASKNTNPSTGKPIWNRGVDDPIDSALKIFSFIASEAYAPRLGKDFVKGLESQSLSGMMGELASGAMPARIHEVDLQRQFERFLLDHNKRFANVKSGINQLYRNTPMSDETIREIIDDNIEARRKMNYELMRVAKGYNSLGIDASQVINTMNSLNIGKKRTQLLSYGFMEKPSMKHISEILLKESNREYGPERLKTILEYYQTKNRYVSVVPVTETD